MNKRLVKETESNLAKNIKQLLRKKEIKDIELCNELNLNPSTFYRLLNNESKGSVTTLIPIAQYFDITLGQLLGLEPLENLTENKYNYNFHHLPFIGELFQEINNEFHDCCKEKKKFPQTIAQALEIINEIYDYTYSKSDQKIEKDFIEWIIKKTL